MKSTIVLVTVLCLFAASVFAENNVVATRPSRFAANWKKQLDANSIVSFFQKVVKGCDIRCIIAKHNQEFMQRWAKNDMNGVAQLYTEDCRLMSPGSDVEIGRAAVAAAYTDDYNNGMQSLKLQTDEIIGKAGDPFVVERSHYWMYNPQGQVAEVGKYVMTWKNVGNDYQIYIDIFNANSNEEQD